MYEVERYTSVNDVGTAVLFERLIDRPVRRVVTASSMSIYGAGLYRDEDGRTVQDAERGSIRDNQKIWDQVARQDRTSVVSGKSVSVRVDHDVGRTIKKKNI